MTRHERPVLTAPASFEHIALDIDDVGRATITLDRPDRLNAYAYRMGREVERGVRPL
ncbi:MAG: hypothetical protein U5R31_17535 [Acidimicrobiia bacterium]|nr:hypothetical protein [Acidimicrobiia bacterium]